MKKLMLIVFGIFFSMMIVFANSMAPTSIPGKAGIFVDKESGIELIDEKIIITIDDSLDKTHYLVNYTFKNINDNPIEKPIWFLTRGQKHSYDLKVYIDNTEVKSNTIEVKSKEIENWKVEDQFDYIDPFTNDFFDPNIDQYYSNHLIGNEFLLKIDSGQLSNVKIEYERSNGYISPRVTDYINDVKLTSYMLSPATFYEGDGAVDITIRTPINTILKSNIKLDQKNNQSYEINNYKLKEYENLHLSFAKKPGYSELFAHDKKGFMIRLMILQSLLLLFIFIVKNQKIKKLLGLIFIASFIGYMSIGSYGTIFNIMLFSFLMIPILIISWVIYYIKKNKKLGPRE